MPKALARPKSASLSSPSYGQKKWQDQHQPHRHHRQPDRHTYKLGFTLSGNIIKPSCNEGLEDTSYQLYWLKPFTPMSDQDRISPYNINTIASRQVMRIDKNYQLWEWTFDQYQILLTYNIKLVW